MAPGKTYRIMIAEPAIVVCNGLKAMIGRHSGLNVVEIVSDLPSCIERLSVVLPDVLIINPLIVDGSGRLSARDVLKAPSGTALVALVSGPCPEEALKRYDNHITIFDDESMIARKLIGAAAVADDKPEEQSQLELSDREKEILVAVARGYMNKQIADRHNISIHTVITHRKNITRKTGIKTVAGLTLYALLHGMIDMQEVE